MDHSDSAPGDPGRPAAPQGRHSPARGQAVSGRSGGSAAVTGGGRRDHLSIQAAAERYGVSRRTLYRLLASGRLTRYRRPGDNRTYLEVRELDDELRLRPMPRSPG